MTIAKKLVWRARLLIKAVRMGRATDWPGVLKEIFSSHRPTSHPPPTLVQTDGGFGLYLVGDHKVWFPLSFDPSILPFIYHEIFVQKVHESPQCRVHPGEWVVDAGACEGFFSLYALEKGANVLAFEPVPELAQALERTLEPFIREGRARVFPVGLGREREEKVIHLSSNNSGSNTMSDDFVKIHGASMNIGRQEKVSVIPLDSLMSEACLPPISFLKADVEGYEREPLLGAKEIIRKYKPRLSICTYHLPDDCQVIPKIIRGFGVGYRVKFQGGFFEHVYGW